MPRDLLIGSGFFATRTFHDARAEFLQHTWLPNTARVSTRIVIVDNSTYGLPELALYRLIRCEKNLGHACDPFPAIAKTPLLGWSLSWILPALVAYADDCDFIYKEQDCLAFGDWLPLVRRGRASIGRNDLMPCEQSLFYIEHDFILPFITDYLLLAGHDAQISTEDKFRRLLDRYGGPIEFHDLPGGRNRPMPNVTRPFYLQKITDHELSRLKHSGLV
jgi:hypothetical protein